MGLLRQPQQLYTEFALPRGLLGPIVDEFSLQLDGFWLPNLQIWDGFLFLTWPIFCWVMWREEGEVRRREKGRGSRDKGGGRRKEGGRRREEGEGRREDGGWRRKERSWNFWMTSINKTASAMHFSCINFIVLDCTTHIFWCTSSYFLLQVFVFMYIFYTFYMFLIQILFFPWKFSYFNVLICGMWNV